MSQQLHSQQTQQRDTEKGTSTWATRGLSVAIAGTLLVISILGVVMAMQDINALNSIQNLFKSTKSKFPSSPSNSPFDDFAKDIDSQVDSGLAQVRVYLYILIAVCGLQTITCLFGMVSIAKHMLGVYKVYFYGTIVWLAARVVLAFLLRGGWYMILSVVVQLVVAYPMWVYLQKMQGMLKCSNHMSA